MQVRFDEKVPRSSCLSPSTGNAFKLNALEKHPDYNGVIFILTLSPLLVSDGMRKNIGGE